MRPLHSQPHLATQQFATKPNSVEVIEQQTQIQQAVPQRRKMIKNAFQSSNRGSSHNHRSTHSPAGVSNFSVSRITKPSDITINERDFGPPMNQNQFRAEGTGQSDQK